MLEFHQKVKEGEQLEKVQSYAPNTWIRVVDPNAKEIQFLIDKLGLDKENVRDGLDPFEIPRIEEEDGIVYLFLRSPSPTEDFKQEPTRSFLFAITKENIITISNENVGILDKLADSPKFFTNGQQRALIQTIASITKSFEVSVRGIFKAVKKDKRNILNLEEKDILDLVLQEDQLNDYNSAVFPLIDICHKILKLKSIQLDADHQEFIGGLIIDLDQTLTNSSASLKTISNMREYYSTTLTNKLNKIITLLTVFTIFLTVPTVLASVYGMNVGLPWQNSGNVLWILLGILLVVWSLLFLFFKKIKIL